MLHRWRFHALFLLTSILLTAGTFAQQYNPSQMKGMKWRLVGPFRGGRVLAVTGIPGDGTPGRGGIARPAG